MPTQKADAREPMPAQCRRSHHRPRAVTAVHDDLIVLLRGHVPGAPRHRPERDVHGAWHVPGSILGARARVDHDRGAALANTLGKIGGIDVAAGSGHQCLQPSLSRGSNAPAAGGRRSEAPTIRSRSEGNSINGKKSFRSLRIFSTFGSSPRPPQAPASSVVPLLHLPKRESVPATFAVTLAQRACGGQHEIGRADDPKQIRRQFNKRPEILQISSDLPHLRIFPPPAAGARVRGRRPRPRPAPYFISPNANRKST
jgi:hypothetical protein